MPISKNKFTALQKKTKTQRGKLKTEQGKLKRNVSEQNAIEAEIRKQLSTGAKSTSTSVKSAIAKKTQLRRENSKIREAMSVLEKDINKTLDAVIFSTDPRDQVAMLDDSYPIFLAPVRIETRFMTVKHIARVQSELLPDSFHLSNAATGANAVSDFEELSVDSIFSGVTELPVIEDTEELWIRIFPDDIAVHTHEKELTEIEIAAAQTYWTHIWKAADNDSLRIGAWRGLVAGRGPERAAWIASQLVPINPEDQPTASLDEEEDLLVNPVFADVELRAETWSEAPHTRIMPDRFVVRLYTGNTYREIVGNNVPDPLHLSIDPKALESEIESADGSISLTDKIKWLQDFDEAEKIGMAIRVPLTQEDSNRVFDKILVLGVKASVDKDEGQELMEDLIENHHYTPGGFSLVPQGTATNNTEDKESGYTALNANEEALFELEMGEAIFTPTHVDKNKTDGQHLADALGIEYDKLQHTKYADQTDIKEAMSMNKALWPVTFGYYLPQMMLPIFSEADIARTKHHFGQYVLGRGRVPAIRVDDQPYGILPTTAFSKWQYSSNDANSNYLTGLHDNVLKNLETTWDNLISKIQTADSTANQGNVEKLFVDVLGLHASSVEFYQRYVTGPYLLWNIHNYSSVINSAITEPTDVSYANSLDFFQLFGDQNFVYSFPPRLFDFFYGRDHKFLDGPVVDPIGIHEDKFLSSLGTNEENYIDWLLKSNWAQIKNEDFSTIGNSNVTPPNALLYLMLRHATLLEYTRTGFSLLAENNLASKVAYFDTEFTNITGVQQINPELRELVRSGVLFKEGMKAEKKIDKAIDKAFTKKEKEGALAGMNMRSIRAARKEMKMEMLASTRESIMEKAEINVDALLGSQMQSVSKNDLLFLPQTALNGVSVADYLYADLQKPKSQSQFDAMHELIDNLEVLKDMSTAKLERCFAEHIDLANYRLDAWFYSLVLERLQELRGSGNSRKKGVYIGAYAWLENLSRGTFNAVHYREVDIKPERVLIPEVAGVVFAEGVNSGINVSGVKSFEFNSEKIKVGQPTSPIVVASIGNATARNLKSKNVTQISGHIMTGANTLEINQLTTNLRVANPAIIDSVALDRLTPPYAYLGSAIEGIGPITYDVTSDRYINAPRVDSGNQGYIHAPSINHATTAAVLRAGYETHSLNSGSPDNAMAVNLNSERVRKALFYLEGVNNGQELGALLGYQFERGLHDRGLDDGGLADGEAGLDEYILEMRTKYPFVAGRVTDSTGATNIDTAEAYNVVNGMELIENSEDPRRDYPYGISGLPGSGVRKNAIIEEVTKLHDAIDGINDLLMAESMHQVVLGNYPKASAVLSAMGGEPLAIDPDVIKTPRTFDVLNHKLGCHFDLSIDGEAIWTDKGTVRSIAEPHLNSWLANLLPEPKKVIITYQYQFIDGSGAPGDITLDSFHLGELGLEPIDLHYLVNLNKPEGAAPTALLNAINYYVRRVIVGEDNVEVKVALADDNSLADDEISFFEIQALLDRLAILVGESRALRPDDYLLSSTYETQTASNSTAGYKLDLLEDRLMDVIQETMANGEHGFQGVINILESGMSSAKTIVEDDPLTLTPGILDELRTALHSATYFGVQNAEPATAVEASFSLSQELLEQANSVYKEMIDRKKAIDNDLLTLADTTEESATLRLLESLAKNIFGRAFKVFPEYELYNATQVESANAYGDYLAHAGENAIDHWLHGISPVRKRIRNFHQTGLLSRALATDDSVLDLKLTQLPLEPVDADLDPQTRWLGVEFPEDYAVPDENVSMLFYNPPGYSTAGLQAGIMVDEWVEELPHVKAHTGLSVHYNNPNSEPAQTCLLAVSPNLDGKWSWDDLMDTLVETLDWAKKRAIDPDMLNDTIYPQVLPAVYAAISASDDTPTLDFGRNVVPTPIKGVFGMIKVQDYSIGAIDLANLTIEDL